jgi:hypothetical protein
MWKAQVMNSEVDEFRDILESSEPGDPAVVTNRQIAVAAAPQVSSTPVLENGAPARRRASLSWQADRTEAEKRPVLIGSVVSGSMNPKQRALLRDVEYCEMRCKFFESQAYVETKKFNKSMQILAIILEFCKANGATKQSETQVEPTFMGRLLRMAACGTSKAPPGYGQLEDSDSNEMSSSSGFSGHPLQTSRKSGEPLGQPDIDNLYASATKVYDALKQLLKMQEKQQQVLRNIAQVTQMDLADHRSTPGPSSQQNESWQERSTGGSMHNTERTEEPRGGNFGQSFVMTSARDPNNTGNTGSMNMFAPLPVVNRNGTSPSPNPGGRSLFGVGL